MRFDEYKFIEFERRGRVLVVKLNRPQLRNAVNADLHSELAQVFRDIERDDKSTVIVITGNGDAFCAGGDIQWMQSSIERPVEFEEIARHAKQIVFSLLEMTKPIICRLNGHAMGLGATIALFCDVVIASDQAILADPHVSVGLVAGDGGALIWPHLMGLGRARRYLMSGESLGAAEAERLGLISQAVPATELDEASYGFADRLAAGATKAISWTKVTLNLPLKQLVHAYFDVGVVYESLSNATLDHREGVAAFRERRKARFTGK